MNTPLYLVTAQRVLTQLRNDHRTLALLVVMPSLLVGLFAWVFADSVTFQRVGPVILALFPFILMFLVTSITTLRERTSGTLERLMTTPITKADILVGYAIGFSLVAIVQTALVVALAITWFGLDVQGPLWQLFVCAIINSITGTAMGLLVSAFARTEFQAVQFLPVFVFPQIILGGVFIPRDQMPRVLELISDVLPLSYAIDSVMAVASATDGWDLWRPLLIVAGFAVVCLILGALTLPRRTP